MHNFEKIPTILINKMPEKIADNDYLSALKNLRHAIYGFDSKSDHIIDFSRYKNITSLSLTDSGDTNAVVVKPPENLKSLFFFNCNSLHDVRNLCGKKNFNSLGFTGCEKLYDISPVYGMKNLLWLSCPPSINQSQFDTLIPSFSSLQVLELIGCDSLKNIEAVSKLKNLKSLTVACEKLDTTQIPDIKNLQLLVFGKKLSEKQILNLRTRFPNTLVVPGKGLCLGSGWILLLLPLVLSGLIFLKKH